MGLGLASRVPVSFDFSLYEFLLVLRCCLLFLLRQVFAGASTPVTARFLLFLIRLVLQALLPSPRVIPLSPTLPCYCSTSCEFEPSQLALGMTDRLLSVALECMCLPSVSSQILLLSRYRGSRGAFGCRLSSDDWCH